MNLLYLFMTKILFVYSIQIFLIIKNDYALARAKLTDSR